MSSDYRISFEYQTPFTVSYREAMAEKDRGDSTDKSLRFKYLMPNCGFCFQDYLPSDELIGLECGHAFHKKCFVFYPLQKCPYDQITVKAIKAKMLGLEILLPQKAPWIAKEMVDCQKTIEDCLRSIVEGIAPGDEKITNEEIPFILHSLDKFLKLLFQLQEGSAPVSSDVITDDELLALNKILMNSAVLKEIGRIVLKYVPLKTLQRLQNKEELIAMYENLGPHQTTFKFIYCLMERLPLQSLSALEKTFNHKFFLKHFKILKNLRVAPARQYLEGLPEIERNFLSTLAQGRNGETSLRVCSQARFIRKGYTVKEEKFSGVQILMILLFMAIYFRQSGQGIGLVSSAWHHAEVYTP